MGDTIPGSGDFLGRRSSILPGNIWIEVRFPHYLPQIGSSPLFFHRLGRCSLGHLHRRHHHVQVLSHSFNFRTISISIIALMFNWVEIRNLPRHQFGNLQSKMFPAYFSMVGVCCAICVASFGYLHPWKSSATPEKYQLGFLLSGFVFNLINLLVFTPMTIQVFSSTMSLHLFLFAL